MKHLEKNFEELPSIISSSFSSPLKEIHSSETLLYALELSPISSTNEEAQFETQSDVGLDDNSSTIEGSVNSSDILDETYLSILSSIPRPPPPLKETSFASQ